MSLSFPEKYTKIIDQLLSQMGYPLKDSKDLAKCVLKLSDEYNSRTYGQDIWSKTNHQAAYLCYFFPLNYLRVSRAIHHLKEVGFWSQPLKQWLELGSGCGTAFFAFLDHFPEQKLESAHFIESSNNANQLMQSIFKLLKYQTPPSMQWSKNFSTKDKFHSNRLFVASYALNELQSLPNWAHKFENYFLIEPALQEETRNLMALRNQLVNDNYFAWAPCTHQEACPLLENSKKDWCFDRFFINMPDWYEQIEKNLPMKNRSLTYSYLGMSKTPPTPLPDCGRVIGDTLKEKGKVRQAICRNSSREFLAWLKKEGAPKVILRGTLYNVTDLVKVSNELRKNKKS